MAKGIPSAGRGPDGKAKIINVDENGNVKIQLSENLAAIKGQYGDALIPVQVDAEGRIVLAANAMEYYGATASERPAVADVPVGAVYMAVQTQELWQSDGAEWVVM